MKRRIRYLPVLMLSLSGIGFAVFLQFRSPSQEIPVRTAAEQCEWLAAQGLSGEEIGTQEILIPTDFSGNYADYAALQSQLRLPLKSYAGKPAQCITYRITSSEEPMFAELLVADGFLIGAQCYTPEGGRTLDLQGKPFTSEPA